MTESELKDFLSYFNSLRSSFEDELPRLIQSTSLAQAPEPLQEAVHYSLFSGGKRIRACILLELSNLKKVRRPQALCTAAALECLHTYSLVHDDLPAMDNDDLRRGKPSSHKKYNEATAILVGDALHSLSFELLSKPEPPSTVINYFSEFAGSSGMVGGQFLDLNFNLNINQDTYTLAKKINEINFYKTGKLFQLSVGLPIQIAATHMANDPEDYNKLDLYHDWGKNLGLLFQLVDDLEDACTLEGEAEILNNTKPSSLNILHCMEKQEVLKEISILKNELKKTASDLFKNSLFLQKLPDYILRKSNI